VAKLLSHYWTAADPAEVRQAQLKDWVDDLLEFGPEIAEEACTRWRRQPGGRRPTPGDIRTLAIEEQQDRQARDALPAAEDKQRREEAEKVRKQHAEAKNREMQLEGLSMVNAFAQRNGYPDADTYAAANGLHWSDVYRQAIADGMAAASAPLAHASNSLAAVLGVTAKEIVED
jgi:hypothetical protein